MSKILLIDDNPDVLTILTWYLSRLDFKVTCAKDGPSGLYFARESQPDLIILDTVMTGMDGFQVAERLGRDPLCAHIPILAFTPFITYERRQRASDAGVDRFVTKPYFLRDLVPLVKSMTGHLVDVPTRM